MVDIHVSLGIATPSLNTIQHMASALDAKSLSEDCLKTSLLRSDAYRQSVRTRFRDACYALLGADDEPGFKLFDARLTSRSTDGEPTEVSEETIRTAVRHGLVYEFRYLDLIRRNYAMLANGEQPSDVFTHTMITRFKDDPLFSLDHLQLIIREMVLLDLPPEAAHVPIPDAQIEHVSIPAAQNEHASIEHPQIQHAPAVRRMLTTGDRVYGRPWYAIELVAYLGDCLPIEDQAVLTQHVTSLLRDHSLAWELARSVHADLLGDSLGEIDFVRRYVGRHQTTGFAQTLESDILASPLYGERIRSRLSIVQMRLYDVVLQEEEFVRLIERARDSAVGVSDDEVSNLLHTYRRECDALVSEVVSVYVDVLSREPDNSELQDEIKRFREADCMDARTDLAIRLSRGYEFHDVVKTRLRSAFHSAAGVHVQMRTLYSMLEAVLGETERVLREVGTHGLVLVVDAQVRREIQMLNT